MTFKLDKIDLRMLYELDKDCRQPLSDIAKKIRKSPQYVKYRIERLKETQVIQSVTVFSAIPRGVTEAFAFIKLKGSDVIEEKTLLDFLFKMPETYRLYYCDGAFDIVASFLVRDHARLNDIKTALLTQFTNVDKIFFHALVSSEIYQKKYLQQPFEAERLVLDRNAEFDETPKSVLRELQKNPFATFLELSRALNLSYDKIKYLFKTAKPYIGTRLTLSNRVVRKAVLFVDVAKDFDKVREYSLVSPYITQFDVLLGEHSCALYFECMKEEEIARIIKEFLYKFKDAIRDHLKLDITNTYKYRWTP